MGKKKKRHTVGTAVKRYSFPQAERERPWLKFLLDAYHVLDRGIALEIAKEAKKGRNLACRKGCSLCCSTHKDIPVYPLELKGLIWFASERIMSPQRDTLIMQLAVFKKDFPCPFLTDGICSVHPLRPMACRQFNVFDIPCKEGEDPYYTRRKDVMNPVKKYVDQAFFMMLPFYGVEKESERVKIIETGAFHRMAKELHSCNWRQLADKMKTTKL